MKNSVLSSVVFFLTTLSGTASADLTDIDNTSFQQLIDEGVPVIDIRRLDEWEKTGVIDGSHLITFFDENGKYNPDKWLGELAVVIDPQEPFVLICHSGGRTAIVGEWLGKQFDSVYNVKDGIASWLKENRDLTPMP